MAWISSTDAATGLSARASSASSRPWAQGLLEITGRAVGRNNQPPLLVPPDAEFVVLGAKRSGDRVDDDVVHRIRGAERDVEGERGHAPESAGSLYPHVRATPLPDVHSPGTGET